MKEVHCLGKSDRVLESCQKSGAARHLQVFRKAAAMDRRERTDTEKHIQDLHMPVQKLLTGIAWVVQCLHQRFKVGSGAKTRWKAGQKKSKAVGCMQLILC